jgi:hypothetical protein
MAREQESKLDGTTHCHCGYKWGEHPTEWTFDGMKRHCAMCGEEIGVIKGKVFIANQCEERYIEKGNYCDRCSGKCNKVTQSGELSFYELFKNKLK